MNDEVYLTFTSWKMSTAGRICHMCVKTIRKKKNRYILINNGIMV